MSSENGKDALAVLRSRQADFVRDLRHRYSSSDFECLSAIGTGAFGVVSLVRCKRTGDEFALKQIRKDGMLKKNHRDRIKAERDLLSELKTEWVVTLHRTFQDSENLYMLMEYLPGGDLMSHLMKFDSFSEYQTKFYMGELIEAVHAVHRLGFIHRDIKPDNIVLRADGHLKLIDFGLCKFSPFIRSESIASDDRIHKSGTPHRLVHPNRAHLRSTVGTPQYMAPEVIGKAYDQSSDFWSVGVIAFECLMGGTPFFDEEARPDRKPDLKRIIHKVVNYKEYLLIPFPGKPLLSSPATLFLQQLLCEASVRIGYDEIFSHSFFKDLGIPISELNSLAAPIQPVVASIQKPSGIVLSSHHSVGMGKDRNLDFVGYTYNRSSVKN